jgi:threonine-phosphate decarboxylase
MKEFSHGGDVKSFAKKHGLKKVIDLSSNINFLKPKIDLDFNKLDISSYPNYDSFYTQVAKHFDVKKTQLELYNGGSSAIFSLLKSLHVKHCTIYSPAYLEYKRVTKLLGVKTELINRFDDIYKKPKQNSLVVFVNPSTPDGKLYDLKKLFKIWKEVDATVLVDESFLEFCKAKSCVGMLKKYKKLYILKSMTKFYASAGVRVGVIISKKKNIKKLKQNEPLWKLSKFDVAYLNEALKDKKFIKKTLKVTKKNREFLVNLLQNSDKFEKIYKSDANFVLAKLKKQNAKEFQDSLVDKGIMIRDCSNFDFLDEKFVRIAVKSKKNINTLLNKKIL